MAGLQRDRVERTGDETLEEGFVAEVLVVLLEMLLGRSHHFDGGKLVTETSQKSASTRQFSH